MKLKTEGTVKKTFDNFPKERDMYKKEGSFVYNYYSSR